MKESDEQIINLIDSIPGLGGMTVNERLYVSGLLDEFDVTRLTNKTRAREILRWLRVDEQSINQMLKDQK